MNDKARRAAEQEASQAAALYSGEVTKDRMKSYLHGWWKRAMDTSRELQAVEPENRLATRDLFLKLGGAKILLRLSKR